MKIFLIIVLSGVFLFVLFLIYKFVKEKLKEFQKQGNVITNETVLPKENPTEKFNAMFKSNHTLEDIAKHKAQYDQIVEGLYMKDGKTVEVDYVLGMMVLKNWNKRALVSEDGKLILAKEKGANKNGNKDVIVALKAEDEMALIKDSTDSFPNNQIESREDLEARPIQINQSIEHNEAADIMNTNAPKDKNEIQNNLDIQVHKKENERSSVYEDIEAETNTEVFNKDYESESEIQNVNNITSNESLNIALNIQPNDANNGTLINDNKAIINDTNNSLLNETKETSLANTITSIDTQIFNDDFKAINSKELLAYFEYLYKNKSHLLKTFLNNIVQQINEDSINNDIGIYKDKLYIRSKTFFSSFYTSMKEQIAEMYYHGLSNSIQTIGNDKIQLLMQFNDLLKKEFFCIYYTKSKEPRIVKNILVVYNEDKHEECNIENTFISINIEHIFNEKQYKEYKKVFINNIEIKNYLYKKRQNNINAIF